MFSTSSQRLNWIFNNENEIEEMKEDIRQSFIKKISSEMTVSEI